MGAAVYRVYARPRLFFADDGSVAHRMARYCLSLGENTAISYSFFPIWVRHTDSDDELNGFFG
jgi:hypothetical protein